MSTEAVHALGVAGLSELLRLDDRFAPFEKTLFSMHSVRSQRHILLSCALTTMIPHISRWLL